MAKNTSISLGDHFEGFINEQVMQGRYGSASEVIRASLRLLEEQEQKLQRLRAEIDKGDADMEAGRYTEYDNVDTLINKITKNKG